MVAEIARRPDVDPRRVGLWGFSQGAWVAPPAASRSDAISFLVLVASTGVTPAEQMLYGTAKHARMAGYGEDAAERIVATRRIVDDWRRGGVRIERAQAAIDAIAGEPWYEHAWIARDLRTAGPWVDMDFKPEPVFARVCVPTLLFYGEDDEWQPVEASIATWRRAAEGAGNRDLTVVQLAGTGHAPTLGHAETIAAVSPEYKHTLVTWLARVTRSG